MSQDSTNESGAAETPQAEWSQFSRRLASFGLGEMPDPLLTRVPAPCPTPTPPAREQGEDNAA